jgi:hypothetical protein
VLTCKELTEPITEYLEGHLSVRQWVRFQVHVGICWHCRAYLRQMKMTIRALGQIAEDRVSPELCEELLVRFRE